MAAHAQQTHHRRCGTIWRRTGSPSAEGGPLVTLSPAGSHHPPPRILTEEGATVEADGGLAGELGSIKDSIVELVREGQGLRTAGGLQVRLRAGVSPGSGGVLGAVQGQAGGRLWGQELGCSPRSRPVPHRWGEAWGEPESPPRGRHGGSVGTGGQAPGCGGSVRAGGAGASQLGGPGPGGRARWGGSP